MAPSVFDKPALYPIIDTDVCAARGIQPVALADACLSGGARIIQLRQKSATGADRLALARQLVSRASDHRTIVIINDRADIAALSGAAGVHVGQEDLTVADAQRIVGGAALIGISTHTPAQVDGALDESAAYVAVGPVYGTSTKDTGYEARGLELARYASGRGKPVVAIGGITLERVGELLDAGVWGIAVIADLLAGADPERRVREYLDVLR